MNHWLKTIRKGESRKVEFKQKLPRGKQVAQTAVAFANGAGGDILFGVDDRGKTIGLTDEQLRLYPDQLSSMVFDTIRPSLIPEIFSVSIGDKTILVVHIHPGHAKPYFLLSEGDTEGVYIRVGATNKKADRPMLIELARQSKNISFDEEVAYDQPLKGFDLQSFREEFERYAKEPLNLPQLKNLKLVKPVLKENHITHALQLLAGDTLAFPQARIQCALFKGNTPTEFIDRKELAGTLLSQIEDAMQFLKKHIPLSGKIEGIQRIDRYEISMVALREAVINAVVHRDYSIAGSDIKVALFDDRLEITSPGCLPNSLDIEDIGTGRSEIRNRALAASFKKMGIVEQWGTGTAKIIDECAGNIPIFKETGLYVKVIFPRPDPVEETGSKLREGSSGIEYGGANGGVNGGVNGGANRSVDELILNLIKKHPGIQTAEIAYSLPRSKRSTERALAKLKKLGLIIYRGAPKTGGYYAIESIFYAPVKSRKPHA